MAVSPKGSRSYRATTASRERRSRQPPPIVPSGLFSSLRVGRFQGKGCALQRLCLQRRHLKIQHGECFKSPSKTTWWTLHLHQCRLKRMVKKILVVADDAGQRRVVHDILEPLGTILEASTDKEALRLVSTEKPELM